MKNKIIQLDEKIFSEGSRTFTGAVHIEDIKNSLQNLQDELKKENIFGLNIFFIRLPKNSPFPQIKITTLEHPPKNIISLATLKKQNLHCAIQKTSYI